MAEEERGGQVTYDTTSIPSLPGRGRSDVQLDSCPSEIAVTGTECCEDAGEWVGDVPLKNVLEFPMSADGEDVGPETQFRGPDVVSGGHVEGIIRSRFEFAFGIGRSELTDDRGSQRPWKPAIESDGIRGTAVLQNDGQAFAVALMDGREGLFGIPWAALVIERGADGYEHDGQCSR